MQNGFTSPARFASRLLLLFIASPVGTAFAHDGHAHAPSRSSVSQSSSSNPEGFRERLRVPTTKLQAPHNGTLTQSLVHYFEAVYFPHQTRLYIHETLQTPLSVRGVEGEVLMQVRGNPQVFRYPLQFVPKSASIDQEYLVAKVDVTRVRDGDMQVTFDLKNLPLRPEPTIRFTQVFALSRVPLPVEVVELTEQDRPIVARQGLCPVTDEAFDHGPPIKLVVDEQPLYVCCEGCMDAMRKNPQAYLAKVNASRVAPLQQSRPQVSVSKASESDKPSLQAQRVCPVMAQQLGARGVPIRILVDDQPVYVCCECCVEQVVQDTSKYRAKAAKLREVFAAE